MASRRCCGCRVAAPDMILLPISDPRLSFWCPEPVERSLPTARLERFPRAAHDALAGQIGPLANLRSSSGCAVVLRTDSPRVTLMIERLRHHPPIPCGIALEVERAGDPHQRWHQVHSEDL